MSLELAELSRRIENIIRHGVIAEVDIPGALVRVQYDEDDNGEPVLTNWRPWFTHRASNDSTWWPPEAGEQVLILSPSGDLSLAIVLPAIYQNTSPAPASSADKVHVKLADGAVFEYDKATSTLMIALPAAGTTTLDSQGGITLNGDVSIIGALNVSETIDAIGNITSGANIIAIAQLITASAAIAGALAAAAVSVAGNDYTFHVHSNPEGGVTGTPQ